MSAETIETRVAKFLAQRPERMTIAVNGVWGARMCDGSHVSSYEKLDYHTGCRAFLEGIKAAGVPFTVYGDVGLDFATEA